MVRKSMLWFDGYPTHKLDHFYLAKISGSNDTLYCKRSHLCDEFLDANASLFQYSGQCADLQFAVIRNDAQRRHRGA